VETDVRGFRYSRSRVAIAVLLVTAVFEVAAPGGARVASAQVGATPSVPASSWNVVTSPNPPWQTAGSLSGVSCLGSDFCEAIGSVDTFAFQVLAESWNGTAWSVQPVPTPADVEAVEMGDVSCATVDFCVAVGAGFGYASADGEPFSETWNGSTWSLDTSLAIPPEAISTVPTGISCSSTDSCELVGSYFGRHSKPFAEGWNGSSWSVQSIPSSSGSTTANSDLASVVCLSPDDCEAVGTARDNLSLATGWNGTAWTLQTTADPTGATADGLTSVSCSASNECEAVGDSTKGSGTELSLAEVWNGKAWMLQTTADPTGATADELTSVSCSASNACEAVGDDTKGSGTEMSVAEMWNGTVWTLQTAPAVTGEGKTDLPNNMQGVACLSATSCEMVGSDYDQVSEVTMPLAEALSGSSWALQTLANQDIQTYSALNSVACASSTKCEAVGAYTVINGDGVNMPAPSFLTLAEEWNGTTWSIQTTPEIKGRSNLTLYSVACAGADFCEAVGSYTDKSYNYQILAEVWNGSTWTPQTTPSLSGASYGGLSSISCVSATSCEAVGGYTSSVTEKSVPLAEIWNGTTWTAQTLSKINGSLTSVTCLSSTDCEAVGSTATKAIAESWNGAQWTKQATPAIPVATTADLSGVSCPTSSACEAVGSQTDSSGDTTSLAEGYLDGVWTAQTTSTSFGLDNVSCASATSCEAVGGADYVGGGEAFAGTGTVAESWDGTTWSLQSTPGSSDNAGLGGIFCASSGACTAVGYDNSDTLVLSLH
jgi:hypothetical protein